MSRNKQGDTQGNLEPHGSRESSVLSQPPSDAYLGDPWVEEGDQRRRLEEADGGSTGGRSSYTSRPRGRDSPERFKEDIRDGMLVEMMRALKELKTADNQKSEALTEIMQELR
ncbi:hypothetical protein M231_04921 [Tremella mesenterica]|uniref:Uncharacterized protein n=1 Tax=Tremella mesenterica TaxID=5217 RepID=A0A4Q1BJE3_TREME|nr:hypothetical protein M231_04921 [Tremella mesenterica]